MNRKKQIAVLVVAALLGLCLVGRLWGRYTLLSVGYDRNGFPTAYRLDQWTGKTWLVLGLDAYEVKNSPLVAPDPSRKW
jgi:hypothetical protein